MRAHVQKEAFGLENLQLEERPDPEPGPGQVRVRLAAASLNYRDLLTVQGHYNPRQPLPLIPGSDGAGTVEALGPGVEDLAVGDRVIPCFHQAWSDGELPPGARAATLGGPLDGTFAEAVVVRADMVVPTPSHLSDAEAACLPCAGVTAWNALFVHGAVRPGDTVLVQGTGGVSTFALQLAHAAGARVLVTSSSDAKLEEARELGAAEGINYRETPDWHKVVKERTRGRGVDLVVEVGGAGTLARSLGCVRVGGTIAVIGVLSGRTTELDLAPVLMQRVRMEGVLVGSRASFLALNRALEAQGIRPVVDRVFPFEDARAALERMQAGEHRGKIVIQTGD